MVYGLQAHRGDLVVGRPGLELSRLSHRRRAPSILTLNPAAVRTEISGKEPRMKIRRSNASSISELRPSSSASSGSVGAWIS